MVGGTSEGPSHSEGIWTTFRGGEIVQTGGASYARVAAPTDCIVAVHPCAHDEVTSHQCGLNGVEVGEASHPGPRLFQGGRRVFENDSSSDEEPLLASHRNVVPHVSGATSVANATQLDDVSGQLPLSTSSSATEAKNPGPHRRRRRVRSEGSDRGFPGVVGAAIHHDLTLIDSSDDDAPFTVPRSAAAPARPSRKSVDATPQSIQDREWTAEHATGPDSVPDTILNALEEDSERQNRWLLLVSGSQGQGSTIETDFPQWESGAQFSMPSRPSEIQSEVVDMTVEDSDVDEDVEVAPARSVENDRPRPGVSDTSDTESLNAEDDRGGASDIEGEEEIDEDIPEVAIAGVSVRARNITGNVQFRPSRHADRPSVLPERFCSSSPGCSRRVRIGSRGR